MASDRLSPCVAYSRRTCSWMPSSLEARINQESSRCCVLATAMRTAATKSVLLPHLVIICTISADIEPRYWYLDKILVRIPNAPGMCIGSEAFAQIMARRSLTVSGSKSDKKVRSNNPINAVESFHFCLSVRWGRGSSTTFELRNPGKPEKKRSSSWSSSKLSNVHRKA
ncbi:hypothetical protein EDB87DRAFT_1632667 [Lactarius vividus]|nr:hypothetical protein EDB87DRAFT_1632667 [Lactarius vividus]